MRIVRRTLAVTVAAALFGAPASLASTVVIHRPAFETSPITVPAIAEEAPSVTLDAPATPSNNLTPSFSGTASDVTPVTVEIFEGPRAEGELVAVATAPGTGGAWTSGSASPALRSGVHTFSAIAVQKGSVGGAVGTSAAVAFSVDTEPPVVTLASLQPRSNDRSPSFSGVASEPTPVTVSVFAGDAPEGEVVATTTAGAPGPDGAWTTDRLTPALPDGRFTAVATQPSALGNPAGSSQAITFEIDTRSPSVTLKQLPSPSPGAAAIFSGTASDATPVTIHVYSGAGTGGPVVASASAQVSGGEWASGRLASALSWGEYTAVASQPSSIGNPPGSSSPMTFIVQPIPPWAASEGAAAVTRTTAELYGLVDPFGGGVSSCAFEVGATTSYAQSIECGFVDEAMTAFPPAADAAIPVFVRIFGLTPSTTYHFRLVTLGEGGAARTDDATFTTQPPFSFDDHPAVRQPTAPTTPPPTLAASKVIALIGRQRTVPGRRDTISSLLRQGRFNMSFAAPEAGTLAVAWYYPPGAKAAKRALAASGRFAFAAASRHSVAVRLTAFGRHLLARSTRVRLTATCNFTPFGARTVRVSKSFYLSR